MEEMLPNVMSITLYQVNNIDYCMCYKYKVLYIIQIHWDGLVKYNMYMGVFHSTKISVDIWKRALSFEIPLKYTEVFRNFLSGIPVPFDFLPEFSVECFFFGSSIIFRFLEPFARNYLTNCPVSKFSEFLLE